MTLTIREGRTSKRKVKQENSQGQTPATSRLSSQVQKRFVLPPETGSPEPKVCKIAGESGACGRNASSRPCLTLTGNESFYLQGTWEVDPEVPCPVLAKHTE